MCGLRFRRRILLSAIPYISLTLIACSDVSFTPADPNKLESGMFMSEEFTQGTFSNKLDILFVVDNSNSMAEEQQKMGERIDRFMSSMDGVDWQIGITTTDVSDGPFGIKGDLLTFEGTKTRVLTPKIANYANAFKNTLARDEGFSCDPACASGNEQPLAATIMAINKRNGLNKGFFRDGADLGLLVLSDEDEMSTGPANATQPQDVIDAVNAVWGEDKELITYGMVIKPGDKKCLDNQSSGNYGDFVATLAAMTGGMVGSICETDYGTTLGMIAEHAKRLTDYVQLKTKPKLDSIVIHFSPKHSTTFRVKGKRLYFDNPPSFGTKITVDYETL